MNRAAWEDIRDGEPYVDKKSFLCSLVQPYVAVRLRKANHRNAGTLIGILLRKSSNGLLSALAFTKQQWNDLYDALGSYCGDPIVGGPLCKEFFEESSNGPLVRNDFKDSGAAISWIKEVSMEEGRLFDLKVRYLGALGCLAIECGPPDFSEDESSL